ncbi:AraC family transcriptional regulator [Vibrio mangrovi]|nr:helix-turn-helix domain-containing protein [Vibrio mangrovi]MDW6004591.1 helix-turn-helix domain-containing protein [Vibrio mangrovi]
MLLEGIRSGFDVGFYHYFPDLFGICLNEETPLAALKRYCQYSILISDIYKIEVIEDHHHLRIEYSNPLLLKYDDYSALGFFAILYDIVTFYTQDVHIKACVSTPENKLYREFNDYFHTMIQYGKPCNFIEFDIENLKIRNKLFNAKLNRIQKSKLDWMCEQLPANIPFATYVERGIEKIILSEKYSSDSELLATLCSHINMSRWTLNRKLQLEGISYRDVLKKVKLNVACRLLTNTNKSVQEISEMTCFSSQTNFSRFFKNHRQLSPTSYRNFFLQDY